MSDWGNFGGGAQASKKVCLADLPPCLITMGGGFVAILIPSCAYALQDHCGCNRLQLEIVTRVGD